MCKINIPEGATLDEKRNLCFEALYNMKLGEMVEKKDNLSYLSWSNAWKAFKEVYPSATFRVICNPDTKLPYFVDQNVGIIFHPTNKILATQLAPLDNVIECFGSFKNNFLFCHSLGRMQLVQRLLRLGQNSV